MKSYQNWVVPKGSNPQNDFDARLLMTFIGDTLQTKERQKNGYYINYGWNHLRELGGDKCVTHLKRMEARGVLERNHKYKAGGFPKSLRLTPEFRSGIVEPYFVATKQMTLKGLIRIDRSDSVGLGMVEHLQAFKFPESYDVPHFSVQSVNRNIFHASRPNGDRFYHLLSGMPRMHREKLMVEGGSVGSVDLSNLNPLLYGHHLKKRFQKRGDSMPKDLTRWIELTAEGLIYEELAKLSNGSDGDRNRVKMKLLIVMNNNVVSMKKRGSIWHLLKRHFPTVAQELLSDKSGTREDSYKTVHRVLTQAEADLMVGSDSVASMLLDRHPSLPFFTVHDAVYLGARHLELAKDMILERFHREGIQHCNVKIER